MNKIFSDTLMHLTLSVLEFIDAQSFLLQHRNPNLIIFYIFLLLTPFIMIYYEYGLEIERKISEFSETVNITKLLQQVKLAKTFLLKKENF